ncbi:MAG: autotransporter domain-containing protein [Rhizobium sp.]|nr:autotransporter domain-containing protein [Rhizobium sp.]
MPSFLRSSQFWLCFLVASVSALAWGEARAGTATLVNESASAVTCNFPSASFCNMVPATCAAGATCTVSGLGFTTLSTTDGRSILWGGSSAALCTTRDSVCVPDLSGGGTQRLSEVPTITMALAPASVTEDTAAPVLTFTLSNAPAAAVAVNLGSAGGTATAGVDYTLPSVLIPAGSTSHTGNVAVAADTSDEPNETALIEISSVPFANESGVQQQTLTINDDDPSPTVTLSISPASFNENGGTATLTATLSNLSGQAVTVGLGFTGGAVRGTDYSTASTAIVIPAGASSGTLVLTGLDDMDVESGESVVVDILSVSNGLPNGAQQVTATVVDDDLSLVTLAAVPNLITEGDAAGRIVATLSAPLAQPVTVTLAVTGGTASSPADYSLSSTSLVIPASSLSAFVDLAVVDDATTEPDETVQVEIASVVNAIESGAQVATVTLRDNDNAPVATLSITPASLAENGGTATLTATLSNPSATDVAITLSAGGTATQGVDYNLSAGTLTVTAGSTTGSVVVTGLDDALDEADETATFGASAITGATLAAAVPSATIVDDDPSPTASITAAGAVDEGGVLSFSVALAQPSGRDIVVQLGYGGSATAADFAALPASLPIPAGAAGATLDLASIDDGAYEGLESLTVSLLAGTGYTPGAPASATGDLNETSLQPQAITAFTATPATPAYASGGTFTLAATGGGSGNPVLFASTTPAVCSVAGNVVTTLAAGTCSLTADQAGNASYAAAPQVFLDVAIAKAAQAITGFAATPAAPIYAPAGTFTLAASGGGSGNAVVFASTTPAVCSLAGNVVTTLAAGTCSLTADQAGDANHDPAPQATLDVGVARAAQAITGFAATPAAPTYAPGGTFTVSATGGASGNPLVFASTTPAACSVAGNVVTTLAAGTCSLTADQAGDGSYDPAPQVSLDVSVARAAQAITGFAASPAAPTYAPGGTFTVSATGGASANPLVFASTTPAACSVAGNVVTMLAAGTCSLTADQAGDGNYEPAPQATLDVGVARAAQAITGFAASPAAPTYALGGTFTVAATGGGSGNPVLFASTTPAVCSVAGNVVTTLAAGTCSLTADQAGDGNYDPAPQAVLDVAIARAVQAISGFVANPAAPVYAPGGSFTVAAAGGASGQPVLFGSSTPAVCSVAGNVVSTLAAGTCSLTADQAGDANHDPAPQAVLDVAISRAAQAITGFAANPAAPTFAPGGTFSLAANGGASGNSVVFASTSPVVCSVAGGTVTMLAAGPCRLTADQAGNANYDAAPQALLEVNIGRAAQVITGFTATPPAPVFSPGGTFTLSATGGASANPVLFASGTPAVCTVTGNVVTMHSAGTCSLTATQADDSNYIAARPVQLDVAIGQAGQAITAFAANPAAPTFVPDGSFTVSATGGASGQPVVFGSNSPAVCRVEGDVVTMLAAGTCSLTADQAGDGNYEAAAQATLEVAIGRAGQAITGFAVDPAMPVYSPGGSFTVSANGGASGQPVVFGSATPAVCGVTGSTVATLAAGTCVLTADQAGDQNYLAAPRVVLEVAVARAAPSLDWIEALEHFIGESDFDLPDPQSQSPGAFTFHSSDPAVATVTGRTVSLRAPGTTTLTVRQAATANYLAAEASVQLVVSARPDPTADPEVVGLLQAQVDASLRFARAQSSNIHDRLRQLRAGNGNASRQGVSLNLLGGAAGGLSLQADALGLDAAGPVAPKGWGVWSAGSVTVGDRDARAGSAGFDYQSDGLTLGVDRMVGDRAVFGFSAGLGWNDSEFDGSASSLSADHRSIAAYGLWRGDGPWFVDGLLGRGWLSFDIARESSLSGAMALASRDGDQDFGAMTLGYEHRGDGLALTGYLRYDASRTRLEAYRETGLGAFDLAYGEQRVDASALALGLEGRHVVQAGNHELRPFWSVEYREAIDEEGDVAINYVLKPVADDYTLRLRGYEDGMFGVGAGLETSFGRGWTLSFMLRHEEASYSRGFGATLRLAWVPKPSSP